MRPLMDTIWLLPSIGASTIDVNWRLRHRIRLGAGDCAREKIELGVRADGSLYGARAQTRGRAAQEKRGNTR